ncbi:MAG: CoA transferase [Chloroflexi bacterium]|nr:CoA transferase [Chloroflexota bacterium]
MDMTELRHPGALSGITVLDMADQKGAYCTKLLACLGADVIKIEPPEGDPTRNIGPFFHGERHPEKSLYFFLFNTNKRSITLDLQTPGGRDALKELASKADVLVETFPPGYLSGMALGFEALRKLNPALIVTSITGFGQTGPWKMYRSSDIVALATGGVLHECGSPDMPQRMAGSQAYHMGSVQAAAGTLLALYHRLSTGEGRHVDVSLQQSVPVCLQTSTMIYEKTGKVREREGRQNTRAAQGIFQCKDGYVDIGQLSAFSWWDRLIRWLEDEGAAADLTEEKWQDPFYRTKPEAIDHINGVLAGFLAQLTKAEIFNRGQAKSVVIGAVNTPEEVVNDPQLKERDFFTPVDHPELGATLRYPGAPFRLSATPWSISRRAPLIGEHNSEVFGPESPLVPLCERGRVGRERGVPRSVALERDRSRPGFPRSRGNGPAGPKKGLPLEGIRVVEFTEQIAGPMAGKAFADFGAQVVLVENEERARTGSSARHPGTGAGNLSSLNLGHHFNKFNTNKLSVTLNLNKPGAMEIAWRLISKSDVVLSNFMPRVLEKWGLTYPAVRQIKPDVIFVTMPAFGARGPYRDYRTLSWNLMAMCGLDYASGFPGSPPVRANPHSYPDTSSQPFHALIGALAALNWRERTGEGQHVEVCQYESTVCFTETFVFEYLVNHRNPRPAGNSLDYAAPHGVYRCQGHDAWCAVAVFTDGEWRSLCRVIGRLDLIADQRFVSLEDRLNNAVALDGIINSWTGQRSSWEVMEMMQKEGIAAGVVENTEDLLLRDPQLKSRGHWVKIEHPEAGTLTNEEWGFRLSGIPPLQWRRAPLLGEHNDFVLTGILGMSESEINQLIIDGVVA